MSCEEISANRSNEGSVVMKQLLRLAGKHGAAIVIAGVVIGLALPSLSELARPWLAIAIFIFTFGSFLKFDGASFKTEIANVQRNVLMVLWATFGIPIVVIVIMSATRPGLASLRGFRGASSAQPTHRATGDGRRDRGRSVLHSGAGGAARWLSRRH